MKSARKRSPAASLPRLAREDWEFSAVKRGHEFYCWAYEFAREAPWIVRKYEHAMKEPKALDVVSGHGFDEFGNWHYEEWHEEEEEGRDWGIQLQISPGFPAVPYLKTNHQVYGELDEEYAHLNLGLLAAVIKDEAEMRAAGYPRHWLEREWYKIDINWTLPDKDIRREFANWLVKKRPRRPWERRGRSDARRFMADLRALGAFRLLRHLTAGEAMDYSRQHAGYCLYQKAPDWYKARRRALKVLKHGFHCRDTFALPALENQSAGGLPVPTGGGPGGT